MVAMPSQRSRLGIHRRGDLVAASATAGSAATLFE
jgi:hypothetical protein